jgi:hypothetical protein
MVSQPEPDHVKVPEPQNMTATLPSVRQHRQQRSIEGLNTTQELLIKKMEISTE